jgi:DNA-binding transcriptional ArsR family regulator
MLNQRAVDRVFHALGDPTRRAILERLTRGPASVSELAVPLEFTLAAVVQHLAVLEASDVVRTEKVGRVRTCRIDPRGLALAGRWLSAREQVWEERFDRLGDVLALETPPASKPRRKKR